MPVVIAGAPALSFMIAGGLSIDAKTGIASLLVGALGLVACGIARDAGFKLQDDLWSSWGGSPTIRRLRWQGNPNHDLLQRLHSDIEGITGTSLPTEEGENADPGGADEQYTAAIAVLRNRTRRDQRFDLVFKENMEYGFRRNCLGLRPLGILLATAGILSSILMSVVGGDDVGSRLATWGWPGLVSLAALMFWLVVVKPGWVRMPAETYADRLMEAVDTLKTLLS